MEVEPLEVPDAWLCSPRQFTDQRGVFLEWFRGDRLAEVTHRRIDVVQANHSVSRRGTVRGLHFTDVPPGQAKAVYCVRGAILDVVVDVRVGSPAFGKHSVVRLDDADRRVVVISEGLAHGFCALTDTADVTYLVSTPYDPSVEHAVHALDADVHVAWPTDVGDLLLSAKDAAAPSLAEAHAAGVLPSYEACREWYEACVS